MEFDRGHGSAAYMRLAKLDQERKEKSYFSFMGGNYIHFSICLVQYSLDYQLYS